MAEIRSTFREFNNRELPTICIDCGGVGQAPFRPGPAPRAALRTALNVVTLRWIRVRIAP